MLKQRLTINQGPTQSGHTRHQNRDAVIEASGDRACCEKLLRAVLFPISPEG